MKTYTLIKFFHEFGRRPKVIRKGLSLEQAQKIVDIVCYACAEVIETETDTIVYGYDGINFWYGA